MLVATPHTFAEPLRDCAMQWNDQFHATPAPIIVGGIKRQRLINADPAMGPLRRITHGLTRRAGLT
jgi:hypothetical protein